MTLTPRHWLPLALVGLSLGLAGLVRPASVPPSVAGAWLSLAAVCLGTFSRVIKR